MHVYVMRGRITSEIINIQIFKCRLKARRAIHFYIGILIAGSSLALYSLEVTRFEEFLTTYVYAL